MKKKILFLLLICMIIISACGKRDNDKDNKGKKDKSVEASSDEDTTSDEIIIEESNTEDLYYSYEQFLAGEKPLRFDIYNDRYYPMGEDGYGRIFESSKGYLLDDFIDTYIKGQLNYEKSYAVNEVYYAYIDCGNDGVPELAIYIPNIELYGDIYEAYFIIKDIDGQLQAVKSTFAGYRSFTNLNQYGVIMVGGSNGAAAWYEDVIMIDEDGNEQVVYSLERFSSLYNMYSYDTEAFVNKAIEYGIDERILIEIYSFERNYGSYDFETYLNNLVVTYYKIDENDNVLSEKVTPEIYEKDSDYYDLMLSTGLNIYKPSEVDKILTERNEKINYTDIIANGDEPDWKLLKELHIDTTNVEAPYYNVSNPGWEYYSTVDYNPDNLPITLTKISSETNDIIDDDNWFYELGMSKPLTNYREDGSFYYILSDPNGYYEYTVIEIYDNYTDEKVATLDMSEFAYPENIAPGDEAFVKEEIRDVKYYDGILYLSMGHRTYADSAPQNAYIIALDPFNDYEVIWKSQPLVANANNFAIIDNSIVCGYGFTAEKDYLYILDRHSGVQMDVYPLKTKAEYIYEIDGRLYVRAYDTNYVFEISFG